MREERSRWALARENVCCEEDGERLALPRAGAVVEELDQERDAISTGREYERTEERDRVQLRQQAPHDLGVEPRATL